MEQGAVPTKFVANQDCADVFPAVRGAIASGGGLTRQCSDLVALPPLYVPMTERRDQPRTDGSLALSLVSFPLF